MAFDAIDHIWQGCVILVTAALSAVLSRHPHDPHALVLRSRWGAPSRAQAGAWAGKVGAHAAHHCFGERGAMPHLQLNLWRIGVKGSGIAVRVPITRLAETVREG